jgi:osmotically-inducible protein OsmY
MTATDRAMSERDEELSESFSRRVFRAASLVVAFGIVACATTPSAPTPTERAADASIARQVRVAFNSDQELYARHVDIWVNQGVVRLGGYVWSPEDFALARNDAERVPGVKAVDVHMELLRGGMAK